MAIYPNRKFTSRGWFGRFATPASWFWPRLGEQSASGQTVVLGQAAETDLAQPITWAPKRRLVAQVTETDLAQPITAKKTKALAQASETDQAQPLTPRKMTALGIPLEADLAQALQRHKARTIVQVVELDLVQPLAHAKVTLLGQALEVDEARAILYVVFLVNYIRIVGLVSGPVPTCQSVLGHPSTMESPTATWPTIDDLTGVL